MPEHTIYFSTSENMHQIKDRTVKMMVTSPPYWDLKDYEVDNQIGYKEDYQTYLNRLNKVWLESYRVLSEDGIAVININTRSHNNKLILLPNDYIKQMKKIGFKFRDIHYWHKSSGIPKPNNFKDNFEYFLIFSKGDTFTTNDFDFFDYIVEKRVPRANIWNINKRFGSIRRKYMVHPAVFPVEYISRMIRIFSQEKEVVLDPFLGAATTLIACMQNDRICVGYELNRQGYLPLIKDRLKDYNLRLEEVSFI